MTKILSLNDVHFGHGNDDRVAATAARRFCDWLVDLDIEPDVILFNGDTFDNRKSVSLLAMDLARSFINKMRRRWPAAKIFGSVGNHDIYYKTTLDVNSLWAAGFDVVITEPMKIAPGAIVIPWVCESNHDDVMKLLKGLKTRNYGGVLYTHMNVIGSMVTASIRLPDGFETNLFPESCKVINGHIHYPSEIANIINVGLNYDFHLPFAGVSKRFAFVDTDSGSVDLIDNPLRTFIDDNPDPDDVPEGTVVMVESADEASAYVDRGVRVIITNKTSDAADTKRQKVTGIIASDINEAIVAYVNEIYDQDTAKVVLKVINKLLETAT